MIKTRSFLVVAIVLGCGLVAVQAQERAQRARRGGRMGMMRGGQLGLLRMEVVQKDLKLTEDQIVKVKTISEELRTEMQKEFAALREIEDRTQRRAKSAELSAKMSKKASEKLGGVLKAEQTARLGQIRMQVRSALENLADKEVAGKLKLTADQTKQVAEIAKDARAKQTEMMAGMRDASQEERREMFTKFREARQETEKKALSVLTDAQKKAFEEMQGKKIELRWAGRRERAGGARRPANN